MSVNQRKGLSAELHITSLLPGSKHFNKDRDARLPYDVEWRGIKIDVKSTVVPKKSPVFSYMYGIPPQDVVFVYVDMSEQYGFRYWVKAGKYKTYMSYKTALKAEQLPQVLLSL